MNLTKIKHMFIVEGVPNSGKTTILTQLCNHLKVHVPASDFDCMQLYNNDLCVKAKWSDGRVIGVGTAGDTADNVMENFLYFSDEGMSLAEVGCDTVAIAITSHNGRGRMRYKPNMTSAAVELYDVLIPGFMTSLAMQPQVLHSKKVHGNTANFKQVRMTTNNAVFMQLKSMMSL